MKKCRRCEEEFEATTEFFYADKRVKSGLRAICKKCHSEVSMETRDKERARLSLNQWRKNNPEKLGEQRSRANQKKRESGYYGEYYQKNRERINARRNEWLKKSGKGAQYVHKRRSFLKEEVMLSEWNMVLSRYGNRCLVVGCVSEDVTMDHVIPLSLGGRNHVSNLQPLCKSHNSSKGVKVVDYRLDYGLFW